MQELNYICMFYITSKLFVFFKFSPLVSNTQKDIEAHSCVESHM